MTQDVGIAAGIGCELEAGMHARGARDATRQRSRVRGPHGRGGKKRMRHRVRHAMLGSDRGLVHVTTGDSPYLVPEAVGRFPMGSDLRSRASGFHRLKCSGGKIRVGAPGFNSCTTIDMWHAFCSKMWAPFRTKFQPRFRARFERTRPNYAAMPTRCRRNLSFFSRTRPCFGEINEVWHDFGQRSAKLADLGVVSDTCRRY